MRKPNIFAGLRDFFILWGSQSVSSLGTLAGGIAVTLTKPAKSRTRVIFFTCGISFVLCEPIMSLGRVLPIWVLSAFAYSVFMPFLTANLTAVMRTNVPVEMQGRVFSARDTIQYSTIPLGLFLGGFLADHVFEPFMAVASPIQQALTLAFGTGKGSGIAVMYFIIGVVGSTSSFMCLRNPVYRSLD